MNIKSTPTDTYIKGHRESIGMSIRTFREKKGYSQEDLARLMSVNRSTISKVETGKFAISVDYLVRFAWYLDFDINVMGKSAT